MSAVDDQQDGAAEPSRSGWVAIAPGRRDATAFTTPPVPVRGNARLRDGSDAILALPHPPAGAMSGA
ncbi:hypothetical protein [Actinokineospora cianjurensis]|uniref:Uncharacterized protein n=1 Tax=Actinokineospora cianjurensis TaxID=585224 RepID=A0A421AZY7_9PSEU|nr:hypothetical protein [Actinokineospora cianjurensis]RLK55379.1 hypothetical protein CLV68_4864 [Actinokineospora cianjurensis]